MTKRTSQRGAMQAARGALLMACVAASACGDGDELSALRPDGGDGGLQLVTDGSVPDIDAGDGAVIDIDADLDLDAQTDADSQIADGAIVVPEGGLLADGGTCPTGYVRSGIFCFDVNECRPGGEARCQAPEGFCTNTPGSFECTCILGRELDDNGVCIDIDECARDLDECGTEQCVNETGPGRYHCGSCPAGTRPGAGGACTNINECAFGNACLPGTVCTDRTPVDDAGTPTFYECTCPTGYAGGANGACADVDECENNAAICGANAECDNTTGSFECNCLPGYTGSTVGTPATCVNVDECAAGSDSCDPHVTCTDQDGAYQCAACAGRYQPSSDPAICDDVNECDPPGSNPCSDVLAPYCVNTVGGHQCVALTGCTPEFGGRPGTGQSAFICEDIDECDDPLTFTCGAGAVCKNLLPPLKYECSCPPGTVGDPNPVAGCVPAAAAPTLTGGFSHTCTVYPDQSIRCWGSAANQATTVPSTVVGNFVSVVNGRGFSCALRDDGRVFCWGLNTEGQAPAAPGGRFTQLTATEANVCGILEDRSVVCWGRNTTAQNAVVPAVYRSLASGVSHICGIDRDRSINCWGTSNDNRLAAPDRNDYSQVAAGAEHTCAITADPVAADPNDHLVCWGSDGRGQLNAPSRNFTQVAAGAYHTCGLRADGSVACWGYDDPAVPGDRLQPPAGTTFESIVAGQTYTCGITTGTQQYVCWGETPDNQGVPPSP